MKASSNRVFYYRAHANSLGGMLKQPLQREICTTATASLATAGGFQHAYHEDFHVDGLISMKKGSVRVSGSEHVTRSDDDSKEHRSFRSVTAATVEGLNILEVLTADRIVAQVAVDHPHDGGPATISLLGSRFENLRVHGTLIRPRLDQRILGIGRKAADPEDFAGSPLRFEELIGLAGDQHENRTSIKAPHKRYLRFQHVEPGRDLVEKGTALCSLVQEVEAEAPVESFSHMLHIPDFGNVFLGELLVNHFSAQLTMLRVEMGCMAEGSISAAAGATDGRLIP